MCLLVCYPTLQTSIGGYANFSGTTASYNTAVGWQAGYSDSTASQNTFVGYRAGKANNASDVTYIGFDSGLHATGNSNTAVGHRTMDQSSCTGSQNTAIGREGLGGLTSGDRNTAVGYFAGHDITTSSDNTAVGYAALDSCSTGAENTVIGSGAGNDITTGSENVILGTRAGGYSTVLTTGARNILIGRDAYTTSSAAQHQIVLGTYQVQGIGNRTFYVNSDGGASYNGGNTTAWNTTSDRRIKKNIVDNNVGLEKINQIQVRNFEYRTKEEILEAAPELSECVEAACKHHEDKGVQLGVIAQEVQDILPSIVKEESTGVLGVCADEITWHLVNAVKELSAKVEELERRQ